MSNRSVVLVSALVSAAVSGVVALAVGALVRAGEESRTRAVIADVEAERAARAAAEADQVIHALESADRTLYLSRDKRTAQEIAEGASPDRPLNLLRVDVDWICSSRKYRDAELNELTSRARSAVLDALRAHAARMTQEAKHRRVRGPGVTRELEEFAGLFRRLGAPVPDDVPALIEGSRLDSDR